MLFVFMTLFSLTILFLVSASHSDSYVKTLFIQGLLLSFIVIFVYDSSHTLSYLLVLFETLMIKTLFIPIFLSQLVKYTHIKRDNSKSVPTHFLSLLITIVVFFANLLFAHWLSTKHSEVNVIFFGVSLSTIIAGLVFIMLRKGLISHVTGYLVMQNGIFLLSLSISKEMPMIVNLGLLLDLFVAILLLGLFVNKIQSSFNSSDVNDLDTVKE